MVYDDDDGCPEPVTHTLESIEAKLTLAVSDLCSKGNNISISEYLELITFGIGQLVLTAMQQNHVLLLPDLYKQFCDSAVQ